MLQGKSDLLLAVLGNIAQDLAVGALYAITQKKDLLPLLSCSPVGGESTDWMPREFRSLFYHLCVSPKSCSTSTPLAV